MSQCLITGANGFLGKHLVERLVRNGHDVTLLIRNPDQPERKKLIERFRQTATQADVRVWQGDVLKTDLGFGSKDNLADFDHIYHLAAIYDLGADETRTMETNVEGTRRLLDKLDADGFSGCLHFVSSIAVAGDFKGSFSERMFTEGQQHNHVYNRSKFESEKLVRERRDAQDRYEIRIYRPSAIVGHTQTGEMDRIDGPYYGCVALSSLKKILPPWVPLIAPKTRIVMDMVPVDYVASGIYTISMLDRAELPEGLFCFHLTDPQAPTITQAIKLFLKASGGPRIQVTFRTDWAKSYLKLFGAASRIKGLDLIREGWLRQLGIPSQVLDALMPDVRFDAAETVRLLIENEVSLPPFETYVDRLWDYYNRHLDPDRNKEELCRQAFAGKVMLITGGSEGIGFACARRSVQYGARVIIAARSREKLDQVVETLAPLAREAGGSIEAVICDLARLETCDALVDNVLKRYGGVDILFNNAGLSIRRSISKALDRFHDFQRTMQINYFGSLRILMGLLPTMLEQKSGHVLYSSTMGTLAPTPRFGAYLASKSAMDALMDSMAAEFADRNIHFSSIKFPMVRTGMLAPTKDFDDMPAASPEFAAQMFVDAVLYKLRKKMTGMGVSIGTFNLYAPKVITQIYNYLYKIWPDEKTDYPEVALDRKMLKKIMSTTPI